MHYLWSWKREKAIVHLAENVPSVPGNRLCDMLPVYPHVDNMLYLHHFRVFLSSVLFGVFFAVNLSVSAYLVFKLRYAGTTTATVYLTNIGLMIRVLYKSFDQTLTGMNTKEALSLFDYRPLSFNAIDTDYVDPRDETNGGRKADVPAVDFRNKPFPVHIRHVVADMLEQSSAVHVGTHK